MIYFLILSHWLADFVMQTDEMAKNKSKSNVWLGKHILSYMKWMCPFAIYAGWNLPGKYWMLFVLSNGVAHFAVDYFTSRATSKLWTKGQVHYFFVVVGFDQALHMATLIYTFKYFLKGTL